MDIEHPAPLPVLWTDKDCPVCGLGNAFEAAQQYGVCARCGWCDEPYALAYPDAKMETNEESLNGARLSWPKRLIARLASGPVSTLRITRRADDTGGYDFVVDGVPLRETFATAPWELQASIGSWPFKSGWADALLTGAHDTPTGRCRLYGDSAYDASLTAEVHVGPERVIWSRIGIETFDWTPEGWKLNVRRGPAGFAFDFHEYRNAFAAVKAGDHGIGGASGPLTCKHCGFSDPGWKMFEPCGRCGRIYEPSPEEEPPSPLDALRALSDRWGWDPPYAVIVALGAACFGIAYCVEHYNLSYTDFSRALRYWEFTAFGVVCILWLAAKFVVRVVMRVKA